MASKPRAKKKVVKQAVRNVRLTTNETSLLRRSILSNIFDSRRDIDDECGYPKSISASQYRYLYDREGLGTRVVNIYPEECWAVDPQIVDGPQDKTSSFEKALEDLNEEHHIWSQLEKADEMSGIGRFGCLFLGVDDGLRFEQPVASGKRKLLYLRVFDESSLSIKSVEKDKRSKRYGKPTMYTVKFDGDDVVEHTNVHWTRMIHLADNRKDSENFGVPRMQVVFNRIYDIRKVLSGSGEMFWKGAFPGYAFEVDPELGDVELDEDSLKEQVQDYFDGLQRYMSLTGMSVKSLQPQVADPSKHIESQIKVLAMVLGIPWRIFQGTEEARLASSQDVKVWNKRLARRQNKYLSPFLVRPFLERMMEFEILPKVQKYEIKWPDLNAQTDHDKAEVAKSWTEALAKYVAGQVEQIIPPREFFTMVMGFTKDQADRIVEKMEEYLEELEEKHEKKLEEQMKLAGASKPSTLPTGPSGGETQQSIIEKRSKAPPAD